MVLVSTAALQQEVSEFDPQGLSVCSLHVLPLSAWVFSGAPVGGFRVYNVQLQCVCNNTDNDKEKSSTATWFL